MSTIAKSTTDANIFLQAARAVDELCQLTYGPQELLDLALILHLRHADAVAFATQEQNSGK